MASTVDKLKVKTDKRRKLTDKDKRLILQFKDEGKPKRWVARYFEVNPRTIDFIWYPERLEENKRLRRERLLTDPQRYYDKDKHREAIRDIRERKKKENPEMFTRQCKLCGKTFVCDTLNEFYCSKKCRWQMGNNKKRIKERDNNEN